MSDYRGGWAEFLNSRGLLIGTELTCPEDSVLEIHMRDGSNHSVFPQSHESKPLVENGVIQFEHANKETLYYALTEITCVKRRINPRFAASTRRDYNLEEGAAGRETERRVRDYTVIEPEVKKGTVAPPLPSYHTARGYEVEDDSSS